MALELLPIYDGVARMKVQGHWQSDVIAGWAIGTAAGWWMQRNPDSPFVLRAMPQGVYLGMHKKF
jgi:undecaprenyl-diphosphatase